MIVCKNSNNCQSYNISYQNYFIFLWGGGTERFTSSRLSYLQISNFLLSGNQKQPRESANEIFQRALGSSNRKDFTVVYIIDN